MITININFGREKESPKKDKLNLEGLVEMYQYDIKNLKIENEVLRSKLDEKLREVENLKNTLMGKTK